MKDSYGNSAPAPSGGVTVALSGSAGTTFYSAASGGSANQVTAVTIPASSTSAQFWVESTTVGSDTITATASPYSKATKQITVGVAPVLSFSQTASQASASIAVQQRIPVYVSVPASNVQGETVALSAVTGNPSVTIGDFYATPAASTTIQSVYVAAGTTAAVYYADTQFTPPSGPITITGTAAGGTLTSNALSLTVTPANGAEVVVSFGPNGTSTPTVGTPDPITVALQDQYGNPVVASSGGVPVTVTVSPSSGLTLTQNGSPVSGSVTIPAGQSSVTLDATATLAQQYTVTVSAAGYGSGAPLTLTASSNPNAASQLALSAQLAANQNPLNPPTTYTVTITIEDANGNPEPDDSTVVALSSTTPGGVFEENGQVVTQIPVAGSAQVEYVQPPNVSGTTTLTATAAGLAQGQTTIANPVWVSPSGSDTGGNGTASAPFATITHALSVAAPGAVIALEAGTYHEAVTITQAVTLEGAPGTAPGQVILDATGQPNGIVIEGPGASGTTVAGLTVENAEKAGIVAMNTSNLTIADNVVQNNDQSYAASNPTLAPGPTGFTATNSAPCSPGNDCEALHLIGVTNSQITNNQVVNNLDGGIYLTDETGPTTGNTVEGNVVENNAVDCGITLASHSGTAPNGVSDNTVSDNQVTGNGGAGILLATPVPGGVVQDNVVENNVVEGNESGGIVLHTHAPGSVVDGNQLIGNTISGNGTDPQAGVPGNEGIGISILGGTPSQLGATITNTTITDGTIASEYYGVYQFNTSNTAVSQVSYQAVTVPSYPGPVPPSQQVVRTLQSGWNTLSFPYVLSKASQTALANLLASLNAPTYQYFNGGWQQVTTANVYQVLSTPMTGLYVDLPEGSAPQSVTLTPTSAQMPPPTVSLQNGWNLVGPSSLAGSESDLTFLAALDNLPSSAEIAMITDPNGTGNAVANPLHTLQSMPVSDGYAYWVYGENLPPNAVLVGEIGTGNASP
ncbi:MAG: right-handed parallel beta-helix repeat-containing protein [Firmicutes bacterium]|nr:right-handed parallel beta-helix repeat-containing protein [Alicyclobacillaceae bacterium]MCL6497587.1 right-handed parallel beta-helix repeat-containing protein [Bacillota bacterium]